MSVRFMVGATFAPSTSALIRPASSGVGAWLLEDRRVHLGRGAAVEILVLDRDQAFVEERVALTGDLHEVTEVGVPGGAENPDATTAGRGVDADDLLIAAELLDRDVERDRVDVEAPWESGSAGRSFSGSKIACTSA